uniref:Uncharacterized protein n=1 Tax=Stegastes partitus TaxID=144197 RepID=A0A3B5B7K0_9TELE
MFLLTDKYLLNILTTAALKTITIEWLKPEPPSYNTWIQKVWDIYQTEQITKTSEEIMRNIQINRLLQKKEKKQDTCHDSFDY